MTTKEQQPIINLLIERDRENPIVIGVVNLLQNRGILSANNLIDTPAKVLEEILPTEPRVPYSPLALGRALKAVAESNNKHAYPNLQTSGS